MKTRPAAAVAFLLGILLSAHGISAQEEGAEALVKKLKGQAGQAPGGLATRGIKTRGINPAAVRTPVTATRSVLLSRGVPKSVQAAAEEDKVEINTGASGAAELSYKVDPESEVSRDNIFFRKGSDDFADDASLAVIVTLADALKSPELKGLKYVVEGHASAEGNGDSNLALSQERAERIVSVMASLGVERARLVPVGFGETQARFPDSSPEALLQQDRRVLIFRLER